MKRKIKIDDIAAVILLLFFALLILFPVYVILLNSFKTRGEMLTSILAFPKEFTLDNFAQTIAKLKYFDRILNTFIVTSLSVLGIVYFGAFAGYKIARTKTKLSRFLYIFFTCSMLVPFHSIMISLTQISSAFHIRDSLHGLIFIYIGLGVNFAVFLFAGFVGSIPTDLEEAAAIDGCNNVQIFTLIVFPLLKPIATTVAIIDILWIWNDFMLPLIMLTNSKNYTLILGIYQFFGQYNTDWTKVLAGLTITSIPIMVFYLFFQKNIMKGIADGAVKG